jgi:hypothetical protein
MGKEIQKHQINEGSTGIKKLDLSSINIASLGSALSEVVLPRLYYQLIIFVLDGTGSMTWDGKTGKPKGEEVNEAIHKIIDRLLISKNKNCFDIAAYAFAEENQSILKPTLLTNDLKEINFNPTVFFPEKYTYEYLDDTLDIVEKDINEYYHSNKEKNCQALVIILSDGAIKHYNSASEKISNIKLNSKTTISSILFEDIRWENDNDMLIKTKNKLMSFASSGIDGHSFFMSDADPEEIRKHMIKSISTVSKID